MGNYRFGSGYFGSDDIKVSLAGEELLNKHKPTSWNGVSFQVYKFNFVTYNSACHIKLNGSDEEIYLGLGQIFEMNEVDKELTSFVIVEANINHSYVGAY